MTLKQKAGIEKALMETWMLTMNDLIGKTEHEYIRACIIYTLFKKGVTVMEIAEIFKLTRDYVYKKRDMIYKERARVQGLASNMRNIYG